MGSHVVRKLRVVAEVAASSAVLALEAAWISVLFAGTLALLDVGDTAGALRLAVSLMLVCGVCTAAGVVAIVGMYRRERYRVPPVG